MSGQTSKRIAKQSIKTKIVSSINNTTNGIDNEVDDEKAIEENLAKLEAKLTNSFKKEFISSLCYLIKTEHQRQTKFEANLIKFVDWSKLDYFLKQLKKICKQKAHLQLLLDQMLLMNNETNQNYATNSDKKQLNIDYSNLLHELTEFNSESYFSLIHILVRFLFKLFKIKSLNESDKLFNLVLILLSSIADLCYYQDIRLKILDDPNLGSLMYILSAKTNSELLEMLKIKNLKTSISMTSLNSALKLNEEKYTTAKINNSFYSLENMRKLWSKMCRLSANLCQEKYTQQIKELFTPEFIASLSDLTDQIQHAHHSSLSDNNRIDMCDLDFYHSLLRFVRYGSELVKIKNLIVDKRLLVHICKFMFKLTKTFESNNEIANDKTSSSKVASIKDLLKQYLLIVDTWSQTQQSCEFYNQLIEGNAIEHFLYQYTNKESKLLNQSSENEITSANPQRPSSSLSITSSASSSTLSSSFFSYSEFSFNLLYKICNENPSCRAEFGRHGGLAKYLTKIESIQIFSDSDVKIDKNLLNEYEKLIEMICMSCKEAVNRARLRDQGHLVGLLKLQQKLFNKKTDLLKILEACNYSQICLESSLYNKLLVALCCFAHDAESMNLLLSNGLIDSLLAYLNESVSTTSLISNSNYDYNFKNIEELLKYETNTVINLKDILTEKIVELTTEQTSNNSYRKRKVSDSSTNAPPSIITAQGNIQMNNLKLKKQKLSNEQQSPPLNRGLISPTSQNYQSIESNLNYLTESIPLEQHCTYQQQQFEWRSPSESHCSLSPQTNAYSPAFSLSPPQNNYTSSTIVRSNSANMFQSSYYFSSNRSPSCSSMTDLSLSPYLNYSIRSNSDEANDFVKAEIQFSPSISINEDETLNDQSETIDEDEINEMQEEIETNKNEKKTEKVNLNLDNYDTGSITISNKKTSKKKEVTSSSLMEYSFELSNTSIKKSTSSISLDSSSSTQHHIESINRTEACVFYVLSQLTHGDKPSSFLLNNFNNFDSILACLLNYLKNAKVRNPRALRILNRLTKNQYCFFNFILSQFPYKIKKYFYDQNYQNERENYNMDCIDTNKKEKDIEKEMNIYLNSNKAFFDALTFFPSFESIEFTLCNNLKSQCISSSDSSFLCLVTMMKQQVTSRKIERLSCALVAPFILRNSKALNYIMIHLNGLDIILDSLLGENLDLLGEEAFCLNQLNESLKFKSILCVKKILSFINYKRNLKQVNMMQDLTRKKIDDNANSEFLDNEVDVYFTFNNDTSLKKVVNVKPSILTKKSEYFTALLKGFFIESNTTTKQFIEIKDVSYEAFTILIETLKCQSISNEESIRNLNMEITFEICYDLVLACDRFFLIDLKDFFISILIIKFLTLTTWPIIFRLAWFLNNSFLANASIDFLLSNIQFFPILKSKLHQSYFKATHFNENNERKILIDENIVKENNDDEVNKDFLVEFINIFDYLLNGLKSNNLSTGSTIFSEIDHDKSIIDHFRKVLKNGLSEIIKNSYLKL